MKKNVVVNQSLNCFERSEKGGVSDHVYGDLRRERVVRGGRRDREQPTCEV